MKILVTGGTGFIGSHTCVELLDAGFEVVILDNLYNSQADVVDKIESITGKKVTFYEADCCDEAALAQIFAQHKIDAAIHFAGYKAVGESVAKPLMYYQNNLMSTLALCKVMAKHNCKRLVFSSSATVYGNPASVPIYEDFPLGPTTNPYGTTKLMIEQILKDLHVSDSEWNIALLRYFNPIGAHKSCLLYTSTFPVKDKVLLFHQTFVLFLRQLLKISLHTYLRDRIYKDVGCGLAAYVTVSNAIDSDVPCLEKAGFHNSCLLYTSF